MGRRVYAAVDVEGQELGDVLSFFLEQLPEGRYHTPDSLIAGNAAGHLEMPNS